MKLSAKMWIRVRMFAVLAALGAVSTPASAALTVDPYAPYSIYKTGSSSTVYYASISSGSPLMDEGFVNFSLLDIDSNFSTVDTTGAPVTEENDDASRSNMLRFKVSSNDVEATEDLLVVYAETSNGKYPVPIAWVGSDCDGNSSCRQAEVISNATYGYRFGANYSKGQTLSIGLYPQDICNAVYHQDGEEADGCTGDEFKMTGTMKSETMTLTFAVIKDPDNDGRIAKDTELGSHNKVIKIVFEHEEPAFSCLPVTSLVDSYFPGDGEIELDTGKFLGDDASAPLDKLIVLGKVGTSTVGGTSFASDNNVVARVGYDTGVHRIAGFTNSTSAGPAVEYALAFGVRDSAGVISSNLGSADPTCMSGVQTSAISGVLTESKCFIATAAFGGGNAGPVMLLRQFRDEVLQRTLLGRAFVEWYYRWSPEAANWLFGNPVFKGPVLRALIPMQAIAWMLLHPRALGAWMLVVAGVMFLCLNRVRGSSQC